ncbi:hypothetical protein LWI29_028277 [Acer saccharum]|uniref:Uncharacterized protein n=1 Tax=Acer saccharum TaxID=4024 RepID=A0AA39S270_ACESA|nr:hypothetical protein LWI29_028277 [Acer saccharum]
MKVVSDHIDRIRDALAWLCSSNPRLNEFGRYCTTFGLQPQRFLTDMPVRWNSTYLKLLNCLEYESPISGFYNMKMSELGRPTLTPDDWHVAKIFVQFLKVFYDSTVTLSGVYYPTSSLIIHHIVEMFELLNNYREDEILGPVVVAMETKFKKYWSEIPFLYALGVIIDPRVKLSGLETLLDYLRENLSVDYSAQVTDIQTKLFEVFSTYERSAELTSYLEAQFDSREKGFELLVWWKTYGYYKYLILSHLAQDVLVISVSTVSLEQVFSTTERIDEERRNSLTPDMVEVLACVQDWEHAKKRLQNEMVDEQLIQNFSNLYVEESSGSNQI